MKHKEVVGKEGCYFVSKVSNKLTTVRLDRIEEYSGYKGHISWRYYVTNTATGRKTVFKSAQKLRSEVKKSDVAKKKAFNEQIQSSVAEDTKKADNWVDDSDPQAALAKVMSGNGEDKQEPDPTSAQSAAGLQETAAASGSANSEGEQSDPFSENGGTQSPTDTQETSETPTTLDSLPSLSEAPTTNLLSSLQGVVVDVVKQPSRVNGSRPIAGRVPTPEQLAILEKVLELSESGITLVIEAGAGAGKTATLQMIEEVRHGKGQYTAFNRSIVEDSRKKFRKAACNTTHSLAFRTEGVRFASRLNGGRVKSWQVAQALGIAAMSIDIGPDENGERKTKILTAEFLASRVRLAISKFCQSADYGIDSNHFRYIDGIDPHVEGKRSYVNNKKVVEYLLPFAEKMWADLINPEGTLPFSHDVYVKIWQLGTPFIACDYILLDEDQDTAPVMVSILQKQSHAQMILVGDENQSIYSWRGAINATRAFPDSERLFLTQSFRFGQAVADVANSVLETLEEPTELRLKGFNKVDSRVLFEQGEDFDCLLCRTNAAAVSAVLSAKKAGKKPHLIGKIDEIVSFVKAAKELQLGRTTNHPELACFESWQEVQAYVKEDEGEDLKLLVKLVDEFGCDGIIDGLEHMSPEKYADMIACTAHKSKGREWNRVKLAGDFPTTDKMNDEAIRLLYVAVTRAKLQLDLSECPPFFDSMDKEGNPIPKIEITWTPVSEVHNESETVQMVSSSADPQPEALEAPQPNPLGRIPEESEVQFTWAKGRQGDWLIRGPKGYEEEEVIVTKRNGSTSRVRLGEVIWEHEEEDVALYEPERK